MEDLNERYNKKNPFSVPENYFDSLEDRIIKRIEEEKKPQRPNLVRLLRPFMGLAALFLMAMLIVQLVLPRFIDQNRMLLKVGESPVEVTVKSFETELDTDFNPTREEIIEYLSQEVDFPDLLLSERL